MNFKEQFWSHIRMDRRPEICTHPPHYTCQNCRNADWTKGHMDHN